MLVVLSLEGRCTENWKGRCTDWGAFHGHQEAKSSIALP
jgi:hypothetical protein